MTSWRLSVICSLVTVLSGLLVDCDVPPSHNHGPIVMGIANDHCDNAEVSAYRLFHSAIRICKCNYHTMIHIA